MAEPNSALPVKISPLAGKLAEPSMLVDVSRLVAAYYGGRPDPTVPAQRVSFGTSGHRGFVSPFYDLSESCSAHRGTLTTYLKNPDHVRPWHKDLEPLVSPSPAVPTAVSLHDHASQMVHIDCGACDRKCGCSSPLIELRIQELPAPRKFLEPCPFDQQLHSLAVSDPHASPPLSLDHSDLDA